MAGAAENLFICHNRAGVIPGSWSCVWMWGVNGVGYSEDFFGLWRGEAERG